MAVTKLKAKIPTKRRRNLLDGGKVYALNQQTALRTDVFRISMFAFFITIPGHVQDQAVQDASGGGVIPPRQGASSACGVFGLGFAACVLECNLAVPANSDKS
jgi:hypothetical protein